MNSQGRALWLGDGAQYGESPFPRAAGLSVRKARMGAPRQGRALVQQAEGFPSLGGFELVFGEDGVELAGECVAIGN